jgi:hypothetical protein
MAKPTKKLRGMDAVIERTKEAGKTPKSAKRRPIMRRKGAVSAPAGAPKKGGMTVVIAVGSPKMDAKMGSKSSKTVQNTPMPQRGDRPKSTQDILARMEARIAELEAKLAQYGEEDEESEDEEDTEHAMGTEDEED